VANEHFRPKGAVTENKKKIPPGYYWLAAAWPNLFPSCTDCNSERYHQFPQGMLLRGKANQFPLADPKKRARFPGKEKGEKPLILDPGDRRAGHNPERHLEFLTEAGKEGIVRAAEGKSKRVSVLGQQSIEVFALDRPMLIHARLSHAIRVRGQLRAIEFAAEDLNQSPGDTRYQKRMQALVEDFVNGFLAPASPYLAMVRQLTFPKTVELARKFRRAAAWLKPVLPTH
jgi:hypothetical protein